MPPSEAAGTLAICAIAKNEARYLLEWIAFHLLAGVEHIRVYDNESIDGTGQYLARLARHYPVEPVYWPTIDGRSPHYSAVEHGLRALRGRFAFVAKIDLDEFLFTTDGSGLAAWLQRLPADVGAIGVNQSIFGSSGHADFQPDLVISRFTRRKPDADSEHRFIKSIARPERVRRTFIHSVELAEGRYVHVDGSDLIQAGEWHGQAERIVAGDVRLHHYILKSLGEFEAKRQRGGATGRTLAQRLDRYHPNFFSDRDAGANHCSDTSLADWAPRVRAAVTEMAGRIGDHVGWDRLVAHYEFLAPHAPRPSSASAAARGRGRDRPRVYVHLGVHRTGTGSIQAHLAARRDEFAAAGMFVPRTGTTATEPAAHHRLARGLDDVSRGEKDGTLWAELRAELEGCGHPNAILSSADFSLLTDTQVADVRRRLDGFQVVPIVVLRRPADALESAYRAYVAAGGSELPGTWLPQGPQPCNSHGLLMRWREVAGDGPMMIASYDDPAVGRDVVAALRAWLGLPARSAERNVGIGRPAALIAIVRHLRQAGTPGVEIDRWLTALGGDRAWPDRSEGLRLIPDEWSEALDARYAAQLQQIEENERLAPHFRGALPRPQARPPRASVRLEDAILALSDLVSAARRGESAAGWVPRPTSAHPKDAPGGRCNGYLDQPGRLDGVVVVRDRTRANFAGWVFDASRPRAERCLVLRPVDRTTAPDYVLTLEAGIPRPDVARAFPDLPAEVTGRAGFRVAADMSMLPRGRYVLGIACVRPDGLVYASDRVAVEI